MFAVILLSNFRLQALLRHRPELWAKPVAVVDDANAPQNASGTSKKQPASQVVELTPAAASAGVQIGMTPTQALARCLSLQILNRAPQRRFAGLVGPDDQVKIAGRRREFDRTVGKFAITQEVESGNPHDIWPWRSGLSGEISQQAGRDRPHDAGHLAPADRAPSIRTPIDLALAIRARP